MNLEEISEVVLDKLSDMDIEYVYIFGSYAKNENNANSDVDIAFYSFTEYDSFEVFLLAQKISSAIKKEVDLVQLKQSSTVFQKEVVEHGVVIFEKDRVERELFEIVVFKKYMRLNEERRLIIENYEV